MLDVVTDNSLNKGSSFVNNVSVQNCDPSTDSTFCDFAGTPDTVTDNARNKSRSFVNNVSVPKCVYCTGLHSLENCEKFLLLSVEQRSTLAREM
jgi:nitrogenase subunit NifH